MPTLNKLKDWLEKGGKVWHPAWDKDEWMVKNDYGSFVDNYGMRVSLDVGLVLSDAWVKVEEIPKQWKPTKFERYYSIYEESVSGTVLRVWRDNNYDRNSYASYNCFKTRKEAEQAHALWLAERELRSLTDDGHYCIYYDSGENQFVVTQSIFFETPYHFSTGEKAAAAIKQLGEEKLKLIYGVK